jgi:16S rRNA C967 or C1407 C5-methylase (RsmB/RsmF family)
VQQSLSGPDSPQRQAARPTDGGAIRAVPWLDERLKFYAVPSAFNLSKSACFRQGRIYGQDASSGAAVAALLTAHFDDDDDDDVDPSAPPSSANGATALPCDSQSTRTIRVLDLCCCPGLKLCAMADFFRQQPSLEVQLVGVDVSSSRMATCRKVVHKYQIDVDDAAGESASPTVHIQLYCHDGTQLAAADASRAEPGLVFDSRVAREQRRRHLGKRKRQNKSSRARECRLLREALLRREQHHPTFASGSFDYVLVDAECSTDGSVRHVQHRLDKTNHVPDNPLVTDPQQLADLVGLQRKLAGEGFRLLKPSGCMVYSTCSLSREQNEGVVEWLLQENPDAKLIPGSVRRVSSTSEALRGPDTTAIHDRHEKCSASGRLPGTIRLGPAEEQREGLERDCHNLFGDGFFLAKILKTRNDSNAGATKHD